LIEEAKEYAAEVSGSKIRALFDIANDAGQELAKKIGADEKIVMLGTLFMDILRGKAVKEGRLDEHTQMSADCAAEFLEKKGVDKETISKVVHCVMAHHGDIEYESVEAEIVCNADCYKFLSNKGFCTALGLFYSRYGELGKSLEYLEEKMDEKWEVLSLKEAKEEIGPNYEIFKEIIKKTR